MRTPENRRRRRRLSTVVVVVVVAACVSVGAVGGGGDLLGRRRRRRRRVPLHFRSRKVTRERLPVETFWRQSTVVAFFFLAAFRSDSKRISFRLS